MRRLLLAAMLLVAGCLGNVGPDVAPSPSPGTRPMAVSHVLVDALEPAELAAPNFKLLGSVAKGGPVYGAGEPSIWAALDSSIYVAFPGCDNGPYYVASIPGSAPCQHGPVYKSTDRGATWKRLNHKDNGRLTAEGPSANGDNDVTTDADGTVYASNLGGGIQVLKSADGGATWSWIGNVVPVTGTNAQGNPTYNSDRNWMAAAAPGNLIVTWMGSAPGSPSPQPRAVGINTTFDGGATWTGATYVSKSIGWLGTVQFHPEGRLAYIPFTLPTSAPSTQPGLPTPRTFELHVAKTIDAGRAWTDLTTGITIRASAQGGHWSGVLMAPTLDVTGDGHVVYAWSEEVIDPVGLNAIGSRVRFIASGDNGTTWSQPVALSTERNAILPWVTGGAGDRFSVVYYSTDVAGDTDYVPGPWQLNALVVDGASQTQPKVVKTVVDPTIHIGNICTRGGGCQHPVSDRELLDFFESDLMPDGSLVIVYPADDARNQKSIEIRTAIQTGGTRLLTRAAPGAA